MNNHVNIKENSIIKEIVARNYQTARVFEKYGIDFCCRGNRALNKAAGEGKINLSNLITELKSASEVKNEKNENFNDLNLADLSRYITDHHHSYVREAIPRIKEYISKIENRHGKKYTFISNINELFSDLALELQRHMEKEEKILFPIVKYLSDCDRFSEKPRTRGYGTIKNPVNTLEEEHESAGGAMSKIRGLTGNYNLPEDACTTFALTYKELVEFEYDLHKHVHLENNILFPKAVKLEEDLLKL